MDIQKVGFGIIGAGMIADLHARAISQLDNTTLIGVFDLNLDAAAKLAKKFNCRCYERLEELLADPMIQAVTIATPSGKHADVAIPAAKAGKHILCEKPIEITLERADAVIQACNENNCLLSPVFQARFSRPVQLVRKAMRDGRFGRMVLASAHMRWYREPAYYTASNWRGTWALDGGGALMNQAIHLIDLLLYTGQVSTVFERVRIS